MKNELERSDYIREKTNEYSININDFQIGEIVLDVDGSECEIINKTPNSIEVFIKKKTNKGIDCSNWFEMRSFNKRFSKK